MQSFRPAVGQTAYFAWSSAGRKGLDWGSDERRLRLNASAAAACRPPSFASGHRQVIAGGTQWRPRARVAKKQQAPETNTTLARAVKCAADGTIAANRKGPR